MVDFLLHNAIFERVLQSLKIVFGLAPKPNLPLVVWYFLYFKFGGRFLLLWGAIKEDVNRILLRCPSVMKFTAYQNILDEGLRDIYGRDSVLLHDSATSLSFYPIIPG